MLRACVKLACWLAPALLLFLHPLPAGADECADSVTAEELVRLLEQEGAAPITVSPNTFIRLQPEIRKTLSGRMRICPAIPLNERGLPYTRPNMDFADIWEAFEIVANAGDWEEARFIANAARANPLPPAALMSLLTVPLWSPDSMAKAAKILRIMPALPGGRFFLLDAFDSLVGKATEEAEIVWAADNQSLEKARTRAAAKNKSPIFTLYGGTYGKAATRLLGRMGIRLIPSGDYK